MLWSQLIFFFFFFPLYICSFIKAKYLLRFFTFAPPFLYRKLFPLWISFFFFFFHFYLSVPHYKGMDSLVCWNYSLASTFAQKGSILLFTGNSYQFLALISLQHELIQSALRKLSCNSDTWHFKMYFPVYWIENSLDSSPSFNPGN